METPSRHEPFEPPMMAKRATSYPSLPPSHLVSALPCTSHSLLPSTLHYLAANHRNQEKYHLILHFCPASVQSAPILYFQRNLPAPRHSCWLHHNGPEELLPSGSCSTDNINLTKAGDETVTLKQHSPQVCSGWAGCSRWQGCVGTLHSPPWHHCQCCPLALGAAGCSCLGSRSAAESPE